MREQEPKYNEVVEKAIETQGVDIGRVKDVELAHDIANKMDAGATSKLDTIREFGLEEMSSAEIKKEMSDTADVLVKHELAKRAVDSAISSPLHNFVVARYSDKAEGHELFGRQLGDINPAEEAADALNSYAKLQKVAKSADKQ
jgi:hypothetical protein